MKLIYPAILAGAAVVGLAAFALPSSEKAPAQHRITVALPHGGTETIAYSGDTVPTVTFHPDRLETAFSAPVLGSVPSFGGLAFAMDQEVEAALRQADQLAQNSAQIASQSRGVARYSVISTALGNHACTRLVHVTQRSDSDKPEVVSGTVGDCDGSIDKVPVTNTPSSKLINTHTVIPGLVQTPM